MRLQEKWERGGKEEGKEKEKGEKGEREGRRGGWEKE